MDEIHGGQIVLSAFKNRQKAHFVRVLREKWQCDLPTHSVCVPTEDGQHFQLSDEHVAVWVTELCRGVASTSQPPDGVLQSANNRPLWNRSDGSSVLRAVSIAPSRRSDNVRSASWTSVSQAWPHSRISSGVPGVGYISGKALKWLGVTTRGALQDVVIMKRANQHLSLLKHWKRNHCLPVGAEDRVKLLGILGDALQMSRPCYPPRINKVAYSIGREVQRCLTSDTGVLQKSQNAALLCQVHICLLPLLLTRISRFDPLAADLAWALLDTLTRVPLVLQLSDTTSAVVGIIARELAYSKFTFQHSWLGVDFLCIIERTSRIRPLTGEELSAIREIAVRRQEQHDDDVGQDICRPWEVALFAQCALHDPWFKDIVLGPHGLSSLFSALDGMLSECVPTGDVAWEHVALTLRALAFSSEHEWIAGAIHPEVMVTLLNIFRRRIPERWFCTRFWAMDTMRNMVSHRPELVRTLIRENAGAALATLTTGPLPRGQNTSQALENYKKKAAKRADELLQYVNKWNQWTPNSLPRIAPVSITDVFGAEG